MKRGARGQRGARTVYPWPGCNTPCKSDMKPEDNSDSGYPHVRVMLWTIAKLPTVCWDSFFFGPGSPRPNKDRSLGWSVWRIPYGRGKVWSVDFLGGSVPSQKDLNLAEAAVLSPWNKAILRWTRERVCEEIAEHFVCWFWWKLQVHRTQGSLCVPLGASHPSCRVGVDSCHVRLWIGYWWITIPLRLWCSCDPYWPLMASTVAVTPGMLCALTKSAFHAVSQLKASQRPGDHCGWRNEISCHQGCVVGINFKDQEWALKIQQLPRSPTDLDCRRKFLSLTSDNMDSWKTE